ncbi:MAG: RluA family pseudouridine synthase [Burkholderiaceae bacterium]
MPCNDLVFLHVDAALLVIVKPSGLPAVPGRAVGLADCASTRVQSRYADARVVHRLDMATSGLMLLARGADAQRTLNRQFAQRTVAKTYIALVAGQLAPQGEIALPLAADWPARPKQKVDPVHGKPSLTHWRVLDHDPARDVSRLELTPVTGRSHQLRVHLQALGHPILGDTLYAPPEVQALAPRLMLHASRLGVLHPVSMLPLRFESAAPF